MQNQSNHELILDMQCNFNCSIIEDRQTKALPTTKGNILAGKVWFSN